MKKIIAAIMLTLVSSVAVANGKGFMPIDPQLPDMSERALCHKAEAYIKQYNEDRLENVDFSGCAKIYGNIVRAKYSGIKDSAFMSLESDVHFNEIGHVMRVEYQTICYYEYCKDFHVTYK